MRVLLVSTYDLGRQPFGLASPAAWLREAGVEVDCADTSREKLSDARIASAGLVAFTAAVFGGIGNIYGAAIGGLVLGLIRTFWDGYFDSAWSDVVIFAILILILVFRPTGILGMRVPEK